MNRLQSNEVPVSLGHVPWAGGGRSQEIHSSVSCPWNGVQKLPFLFWRRRSVYHGSRFISRE